ncbi:MAG: hypothetical protein DCC57_21275 [Chloroflexi bacterium]|nr:MAG: hypothetical protein DCC57_21275 [Chloroflexota bacterium]
MSYCTLNEFKQYQAVEGDGDDALIEQLIASATAVINRATGTRFGVADTATHVLNVEESVNERVLWLDSWCAEVTQVLNGDGTEVASDQYVTDPRNAAPYFRLVLGRSVNTAWVGDDISVTGCWGWSKTVPDDIKHACLRLAAYLYRQKDNSGDLDRAVAIAGNATLLPARLPRDIEDILRPYRWLAG